MSQDSANSNDKVMVLPQFMQEQATHVEEPEEETSWLSNNLHKMNFLQIKT